MKLFKGLGVALITPFQNQQVNYQKLDELVEWHIASSTNAIIILGTTGEAATLSYEEKIQIIDHVIQKVNKRTMVIVGTGTNSTQTTIDLSQKAEQLGADGLLVVTPYYNKPTQRGLLAHYQAVNNSVTIPIILYNVPGRTGVNLLPDTVQKLTACENIKGIKEASGNLLQIQEIFQCTDSDFYIYAGNDDQLMEFLDMGGDGIISVTGNILPEVITEICEQYFIGNHGRANYLFKQVKELNQILFIETNPAPIKELMNHLQMSVGECRLPIVSLEEENKIALYKVWNYYLKREELI